MADPKLVVELVPKTSWFSNVRSEVSKADWEKLKKLTATKAGYRCDICFGKGPQWPVECHEIWHYDDAIHVQTLIGMTALCPACHQVKHAGLAQMRGKLGEVITQLMKVNEWDNKQALAHLQQAFQIWELRSRHKWELDITLLDQYDVTPVRRNPK